MRRAVTILVSLLLLCFITGSAQAARLTLDSSDLSSFTLSSSSANLATLNNSSPQFNMTWTPGVGSFANFAVSTSIAVSAGDEFALKFVNLNGSTWTFELTVVLDDAAMTTLSTSVDIGAGAMDTLVIDLAGFGGETIKEVRVGISGDVPNTNNSSGVDDNNGDFVVQRAPEPGTLLMLASGLLLAALSRRYF